MCEEQTIKEVEDLRAALDEFSAKKESNNVVTLRDGIAGLCADIVKKQVANQLHVPDNFEGVKEIKTCGYEIAEMERGKLCMGVVKVNGEWYVCNKEGERLPINRLCLQSLHNVESALLEVWEGILEWEAQWD